ncbi:MAG: hypothetical protein IN808_04930 [Rubrobacter sp.]|nr:hypothetical protein [Rubrobacter sp.]
MAGGKDFKRGSAEILADLLSEEKVRRVREYVQSEEFRAERERIKQEAVDRLRELRDRYRSRGRSPEDAARERELNLRLAEVGSEIAELRIRLSELLEEEERLRRELSGL